MSKPPRLKDFEHPDSVAETDYLAQLAKLQKRLQLIQSAYIAQHRRALIVLEGWDAAGKGGIIRRLTYELDPRFIHVFPIAAPTNEERERHFLYRFWTRLPGKGEIAVFDRSWYGRVLVERVEGYAAKADWKRGYDEINHFEAQQIAGGTRIVKIFVHITQAGQDKQLIERLETPYKRWKTGADDYRNRARRADYAKAIGDMFAKTHSKAAPWHVVPGDSRKRARLEALEIIAKALAKGIDLTPPPADPELVALATRELGVKLNIG
jgi:AMP-polyphosphate phosphotransferase